MGGIKLNAVFKQQLLDVGFSSEEIKNIEDHANKKVKDDFERALKAKIQNLKIYLHTILYQLQLLKKKERVLQKVPKKLLW